MKNTTPPVVPDNFDIVGAVKLATASERPRPRSARFSLNEATASEHFIAILLGIYLAYAVARLPEVFEGIDVPHLPMILMSIFLVLLVGSVPAITWKLWDSSRAMRLVTALGVLSVVAAPVGYYMTESFSFFRTRYVISLAIFFCCAVFLRDRKNLRRALAIFVLCVGVVAITSLLAPPPAPELGPDGLPLAQTANYFEMHRATVGHSLDSNDFAAILAVTFPIALWLGVGNLVRRIFWSSIALVLCAAVVPTGSRGGMLGFGAAATVLVGIGARGWRRALTIILVAAGAAIFFKAASGSESGERLATFGAGDYNMTASEGRIRLWKQGMIWMIKRPWGYGLNNYQTYFEALNGHGRAAHSSWVQYGVELGVTGLALFLTLCTGLIRQLVALRRRAIAWVTRDGASKEEEALAGHLVAMVVAMMVVNSFLSNAYQPMTYMVLGVATAALIGSRAPETLPVPQMPETTTNTPGRRIRRAPTMSRSR